MVSSPPKNTAPPAANPALTTSPPLPGVGVLLVNLGTPDAPTAAAVRRYLAEFLSDTRVVELPKLLWWPILHGIVLRTRPAKSAAKYASIWLPEGSPLAVWTQRQATQLSAELQARGHAVHVGYAMRYGQPAIAAQLDAWQTQGITRVLVLPLYPQYSATTTASVIDAVNAWSARTRALPELRWVNRYHDEPTYINALCASVQRHWQQHGQPQKLVMSFHGVPERTRRLGDPYHDECVSTAQRLAQALGLSPEQWLLTFQSRFGKAQWLQPYTEATLVGLAQQGIKNVDVICPGFAADCLETLEEIGQEVRHSFEQAGGQRMGYIPCLNDSADGVQALAAVCERHLGGWLQLG